MGRKYKLNHSNRKEERRGKRKKAIQEKEYNKILDNKEHLTIKEYARKYILKNK